MNQITDIMTRYQAGELTLEEANEELETAKAGFYLEPLTEELLVEKRRREAEGETYGTDPEHRTYPDKPDMTRRIDLAGQIVIQQTKFGAFAVTYSDKGYAVLARRVLFESEGAV